MYYDDKVSDGKMVSFRKFFGARFFCCFILPMFKIVNVFLIEKQYIASPNVAFKKILEKVLNLSIAYKFTT